ncbi:hypothetical protein KB879_14045 [Cupriavidus sp. KK10]|nr:hypothetical protein KB879_14045 [Cupriavidus sp. KK10]
MALNSGGAEKLIPWGEGSDTRRERLSHPGYGLLSESADFAEAVGRDGLVCIGPTAASIRRMGDKVSAKRAMIEAGVPGVPGSEGAPTDSTPAPPDGRDLRARRPHRRSRRESGLLTSVSVQCGERRRARRARRAACRQRYAGSLTG